MIYLRDIIEGSISDSTFTPWGRLKQAYNYMHLFFSDIYRSPAASAIAYKMKTGVAKPGYSGHNYGVSIDFDIDRIMKANSMDYPTVCRSLIAFGWTPFQGVNPPGGFARGKEDWHFNFIGDHISSGAAQINDWIASNIKFETEITSLQKMLRNLKFYHGEIDGQAGPLMNEAIKKFKQAWIPAKLLSLGVNDLLDDLTIRTINIVACNVVDESGSLII